MAEVVLLISRLICEGGVSWIGSGGIVRAMRNKADNLIADARPRIKANDIAISKY